MKNREISEKIRGFVAGDKLDEALNSLIVYSGSIEEREINEHAIILASRLEKVNEMQRMGLIDSSYSNSNLNRIRRDVLRYSRALENVGRDLTKHGVVVEVESRSFTKKDEAELRDKLTALLDVNIDGVRLANPKIK